MRLIVNNLPGSWLDIPWVGAIDPVYYLSGVLMHSVRNMRGYDLHDRS